MEAKDQPKSKISWWCSGVQTFSTEGGTALCYPGYQDHSRDVKQLLVLIQRSTIEGHLPHCGHCHVQLRVVRDLDTRRTRRHGSQARQGGGCPLVRQHPYSPQPPAASPTFPSQNLPRPTALLGGRVREAGAQTRPSFPRAARGEP